MHNCIKSTWLYISTLQLRTSTLIRSVLCYSLLETLYLFLIARLNAISALIIIGTLTGLTIICASTPFQNGSSTCISLNDITPPKLLERNIAPFFCMYVNNTTKVNPIHYKGESMQTKFHSKKIIKNFAFNVHCYYYRLILIVDFF